mmetsp:Transcript_30175/g.48521  ORF Transcript_30175/g.48521 Transcript_30175/m.48521 type:complete len:241 (+) Transcript_30175:469-1191(+)
MSFCSKSARPRASRASARPPPSLIGCVALTWRPLSNGSPPSTALSNGTLPPSSPPPPCFTARRNAPSACFHFPACRNNLPISASRALSVMFTLNAVPKACSASSTRPLSSATKHRYPHTLAFVWSKTFASASAASAPSRSPSRSMAIPAPSQVDAHGHRRHPAMYTPRASPSLPAARSVFPRLRMSLSDAGGLGPALSAIACEYASSASPSRDSEACRSPRSSKARGSVASTDSASMMWP